MGDPKRLRKSYERPMRLWDKERIEREGKLREEYGLKNARELWKLQTILRKIRREARRLLSNKGAKVDERTQSLLARVKKFLVRKQDITLDDILVLEVRDILERRLQSVVFKKHMAKTPTQARQFITHGHIAIDGKRASIPSQLVTFAEEHSVDWYGEPIKFTLPDEEAEKPAAAKEAAAPEAPVDAPAAAKEGAVTEPAA
ncbi:MAG: 30S ribosomal protein S4 [Candidatus Micrarchaeia archaeon]|jgi:small subunit ribosomal protein S4